jgi:H+/gluconate symporter-like permease
MLNGIQNFLQFINDNWTAIIIIISLIIAIVQKARSYFNKSNAEKIEVAKKQISQVVLKLITDAEIDYNDLVSAGSIKRSQVIQKIFNDYPILTKATDQKAIIEWIDDMINNSLKELRKIVEINNQKEVDLPNDKSE